MLLTESVVFWFSLWAAFSWTVLYIQFTSIPLVFEKTYGFNIQQSNAIFAGKLSIMSQTFEPLLILR
jgi:hypothetical protein